MIFFQKTVIFVQRKCNSMVLLCVALAACMSIWAFPAYSDVAVLTAGWEYRLGDSPLSSDNIPEWALSENEDTFWKAITAPADVPDRGAHRVVWFRIKLPDAAYADPAVYCVYVDQCFSMYIAGRRIYSYGSEKHFLSSFGTHIIPLDDYRGKYLYMRVYSGWERLGMYGSKLTIGSRYEIQKNIISSELKFVILSAFLVFIGLSIASTAFLRLEPLQFLSVGMFSLLLGVYAFMRSELKGILLGNNYMLWGTAELLLLYIIPVFINLFLCRLFRCSWKNPIKWITAFSIVYACFACAIAGINPDFLVPMMLFNFYYLALIASVATLFALYYSVKGDLDARLLLFSVIIIAFFVGHDVLQEMGIINMTVFLAPWGQLVTILVMLSIAVREGLRSRKNLITIEKELDIARRIQLSIVPARIPVLQGISLGVQFRPVKAVGGDLYDFYCDEQGGLGILIADVAGHGIPAALIASMINVSFFMNQQYAADPALLMEKLNVALLRKCEKYFATALYIYIAPDRSTVRFARAGHLPLLVYRRQTGVIESFTPAGRIIGRMDHCACKNCEISVSAGDRILLYSDGIVENRNSNNEMFGSDRFDSTIRRTSAMNAADCCSRITDEAVAWGGSGYSEDDITVLAVDIL